MLLLFPPGWSLNYGGPHLGLPLLKSYLDKKSISTSIRDLNIDSANYYSLNISEEELQLGRTFDVENAWKFYLNKADELSDIAKIYDGNWSIKSGFNFNKCDLSSSKDIRNFSKLESPFTNYYKIKILPEIVEKNPSVIGINVTVPSQLLSSFELIRLLRNNGFEGNLLLGGNTITRLEEELKQDWIFDLVDGIILNQGEEALEAYSNAIKNKTSLYDVPNLLWKNKTGFVKNSYKKVPKKSFSMPDFSGYPIGEYWGPNYLTAIGARGCYYGKCNFCTIPYAWGNNGFVGFDDPKLISKYLQEATTKWGINRFSFVEETISPKKLNLLVNELLISKQKIMFEGYARFEKAWLDDSFLEKVSSAGLKKLFLGMETLSKKNRYKLNKGDDAEKIKLYLEKFNQYGIKTHLFTMVGYPGTTVDDAIYTLDFLLEHKDLIDTVDMSYFVWDKHTTHQGIVPSGKQNDWALNINYVKENPNDALILNPDQSLVLAQELEKVILQEKPEWTNPIYRMFSSWK